VPTKLPFPDFADYGTHTQFYGEYCIRGYLLMNLLYLLYTTMEIAKWHFNKRNERLYTSPLRFYTNLEFRLQTIGLLALCGLAFLIAIDVNETFYFYNRILAINHINLSFQVLIIFLSFLTLKLSKDKFFVESDQFQLFPIFFLSNLFFLSLLLISNHLMVVLIAIMGINLGLYVLLFVDTGKNKLESGLKYFFLSIFAIILLYISMLLIYLLTYNLDMINLSYLLINSTIFDQRLLGFVYILLSFVFFFKSGIFPSNFFLPEIYKGLSPFLFFYLTLPMKATFFAFIIRLFEVLVNNNSNNYN
jgi:NADH:ubiquinone oxidoreductase subunit 2 (subunit N)